MTWLYNMPYSLTCLIVLPAITVMLYYTVFKRNVFFNEANGIISYLLVLSILVGCVWTFMLKTIERFHLAVTYLSILEKVFWVWPVLMFILIVFGGILAIIQNKPEKRIIIMCFITGSICIGFFILLYFMKFR